MYQSSTITTLQEEQSVSIPSDTQYRTVIHEHGRYRVIDGAQFIYNGYSYPVNATEKSGIRLDILTPIVEQLTAMQSYYSRVYFARFDLHLPKGTSIKTGNQWMSDLFKKLRERLKSKYKRPKGLDQPVKQFAYGWVREKEKAKQVHYHCWIALPQRQVQWLGMPNSGIGGAIVDIWCGLTNGEHTLVNLMNDGYVIYRGRPETMNEVIWRVSYLAKERGKYQTGKGDRIHSTSNIIPK